MARDAPEWTTLLGIGIVTALLVAGGLALGWLIDRLLHTSPILALVGLALGIAGGISYTIVQFRSILKE